MFNRSDRHLWRVYAVSFCIVISLGSTCPAENLLIDSDFKRGKLADTDLGWKLELAKDQKSRVTVVEGHKSGARALRIYNDQRGSSYISQKFAVEPWRWYVAEVWVNSQEMYPVGWGFYMSLEGGRKPSGWRYNMDGFIGWRQPGWRRIQVVNNSQDDKHLTLNIGGGGFSGEVLLSAPVVRECSLVEAASYYPSVHNHHPALYGPPVDGAKGRYGQVFGRGDVCRVARDFPNPFYLIGYTDEKAPDGRVSLVLPAGVRFRKVQYGKTIPKISDLPDGKQRLELPPGNSQLVVDSDLAAGERATGYVQYEWTGGYQLPHPVVFEGIGLPNVTAPKRAMTSLGVAGWTYSLWANGEQGRDNQTLMVRDIKRLGFNRLEAWGGSGKDYAERGIEGATAYGGSFYVDMKKYPESLATTLDGKPCREELMCPSYRGAGLETHPWLEHARYTATKLSSCLTLDDEFYAMSATSPTICFDDRCMKRWSQWVAKNHPELDGISPKVFCRRPHKYPQHYDAWIRFRCDLVAERYAILRRAFHEAVKKSGIKTTDRPMLGAYVGGGPLLGIHSNESLSEVLDYLANMVYEEADTLWKKVAELAPRSGGKLVIAISPGYQMSPPGGARSQVLEAVMGGSKGFIAWGYYMGMTAGHLVDMAEAIKMFAPVEDIILDGEIENGYTAEKDSVNLSARRQGTESVLLVSDYSPTPGRVKVTVPGQAELEVVDLFTDEMVDRLDAGKRTFEVRLRRDFRARLYHLQPPSRLAPARKSAESNSAESG